MHFEFEEGDDVFLVWAIVGMILSLLGYFRVL